MYCYNCGKKIVAGMRKCPYCNLELESILELEMCNTLDQIGKSIGLFNTEKEKIFTLGDREVKISDERYLICCAEKLITILDNNITPHIMEFVNKRSLDDLIYKGEQYFAMFLAKIGFIVLTILQKNGCNISESSKLFNMYFSNRAFGIWEPIYKMALRAEEFKDKARDRLNARGKTEACPSVYIDLDNGGAIKNIIQSDILNKNVNAVYKKGKTLKEVMEFYNVDNIKEEIDQFNNEIIEKLGALYCDIRDFLNLNLIGDDDDSIRIIDLVSRPEDLSSYNKMDEEKSFDALINNPLDYNAYINLYIFNNQLGPELSKIADFCGIETEVLTWFLCFGDRDIFENDELGLKPVGFDTEIEELERIKSVLIKIETNNPIYLKDYNIVDTVKKEQEYHRKVDEIISLSKISNARGIVERAFSKNSVKLATQELLGYKDLCIENLLFKKLREEIIPKLGTKKILQQFEGYLPSILSDVIYIDEYFRKNNQEAFNKLYNAAKIGRPYAMAYVATLLYSGCDFADKNEELSLYYFQRAARYQSSLAIAYIGIFLRKGIMGFRYKPEVGNLYLRIAEACGENAAKAELRKK